MPTDKSSWKKNWRYAGRGIWTSHLGRLIREGGHKWHFFPAGEEDPVLMERSISKAARAAEKYLNERGRYTEAPGTG